MATNRITTASSVTAIAAGHVRRQLRGQLRLGTGHLNAAGDLTTGDLVVALADVGYEQELRAAVSAVPEPAGIVLVVVAWLLTR